MMDDITSKLIAKLMDENIVTKSEMMEAIDRNTKEAIKELKSSNRWTVGTVISLISLAAAIMSIVMHFK